LRQEKNTITLKLNLGCGLVAPDEWINIDGSINARLAKFPFVRYFLFKINLISKKLYEIPWHKNIVIRDLRKKLPFKDDSVAFIYSSHLLEHLKKDEGMRLIKECFRVLKKEAIIRIAIPDLYLLAKNYVKEIESNLKNHYPNDYLISEKFLKNLFEGKKRHRHLWMYDYKSLRYLLTKTGFRKTEKKNFRESNIEKIEKVETRKNSLFMEAIK